MRCCPVVGLLLLALRCFGDYEDVSNALPLVRRNTSCVIMAVFDKDTYDYYDQSLARLWAIAKDHMDLANEVFTNQVFNNQSAFPDLYFKIGKILVLKGFFTEPNTTLSDRLKCFTHLNFSDFCLAFLFTNLTRPGERLGEAMQRRACKNLNNTGVVNLGSDQSGQMSCFTFVHELGHSFGAEHDDMTDCQGIMVSRYPDDDIFNYKNFTTCSIKAMRIRLDNIRTENVSCFQDMPYEVDPVPMGEICDYDYSCDSDVTRLFPCNRWNRSECFYPNCHSVHINKSEMMQALADKPFKCNNTFEANNVIKPNNSSTILFNSVIILVIVLFFTAVSCCYHFSLFYYP